MSKKETALALSVEDVLKGEFGKVIQDRIKEKYADDVLKMLADYQKLRKAVERYESWIAKINEGDIQGAVEDFRKKRARLENEADYEL